MRIMGRGITSPDSSGTLNVLAKWAAGNTLTDSLITDDGSTITSTGVFRAPNGSAASAGFGFANDIDSGFRLNADGAVAIALGASTTMMWTATVVQMASDRSFGWTDGSGSSGTLDTVLTRGAANHMYLASGDSFSIGAVAINDGTNVLQVANGTAPTGATANSVVLYSSDDAAGHTVPSFYCEGTNVIATGQADSASSVRVKMRINGTVVTLLAI